MDTLVKVAFIYKQSDSLIAGLSLNLFSSLLADVSFWANTIVPKLGVNKSNSLPPYTLPRLAGTLSRGSSWRPWLPGPLQPAASRTALPSSWPRVSTHSPSLHGSLYTPSLCYNVAIIGGFMGVDHGWRLKFTDTARYLVQLNYFYCLCTSSYHCKKCTYIFRSHISYSCNDDKS